MRTLAMLLSSYSQPIEEAGELKGVISVSGQRSMWKTLAVWVGVFVVILFITHTVMVSATWKRLEAELAYLKSKGEPLTLRELVGPKIPDAENGAVIYEQAFQMMKLPQMQNHVEAITAFDPATTDAQEWVKISPSLAKVQPIFVIAANAQERSKCQFGVDWDAGAAAVFPHYADLRNLVRLLAVDVVAKARAGKSEEAINSLKLAYRLNRSIENDPILIGLLVQIVMIRIANNATRSCTEQANFSENSAKMLYDELGKIDLPRGLVRAMQGERALGIWCFNNIGPQGGMMGSGFDPTKYVSSYPLRPLFNLDRATYLRLMRLQVEQSRLSCLEMKRRGITPVLDPNVPKYAVVSRILFPVFTRARFTTDSAIAEIAIARVWLAICAYKDRFGSYPDSMKELRSKLGWKLPVDPYSGKDLVYARTQDGFTIYSLGPNMKDDGGIEMPSDTSDPNVAGDIVWECRLRQGQ